METALLFAPLVAFMMLALALAAFVNVITGYIKRASANIRGFWAKVVSFLVSWALPPLVLIILKGTQLVEPLSTLNWLGFLILAILVMLASHGYYNIAMVRKFLTSIGANSPSKVG